MFVEEEEVARRDISVCEPGLMKCSHCERELEDEVNELVIRNAFPSINEGVQCLVSLGHYSVEELILLEGVDYRDAA